MSSCLSTYSPHGAVRILFSFPQLSFLRLWPLVLGLVTSWCWVGSLISSSVSYVSGKPFVPGILCGLSVPLASPGSPSGSCPGLIRTASGPAIYLGLWLAPFRSVSLGSSPAAAQAQLGFSLASGLPPLSRLRVWVRPERGSPPAPRSGPRPLAASAAGQAFHPDAPGASHPAGLRRNAPVGAGLPAPNPGPLPCPAARRSTAPGVCVVAGGGPGGGGPGWAAPGPRTLRAAEAAGRGAGSGPGLALLTGGAAAAAAGGVG